MMPVPAMVCCQVEIVIKKMMIKVIKLIKWFLIFKNQILLSKPINRNNRTRKMSPVPTVKMKELLKDCIIYSHKIIQ